MTTAAILIFGYGNPGRGDDALGPELVAAIESEALAEVECQNDMQLQVEHVTDLQGRQLLLFVDADASCQPPFHFSAIRGEKDDSYTSHAMTPHALLHAFQQVYHQEPPPAFLLRIRGYQFELGESLSRQAGGHLDAAIDFVQQRCRQPHATAWQESATPDL
ncbi:hydrogenase maturation protease [Mariprofundus erugo]|uniref:Hydrogenase maturation protease n=1 Tax=Mariprofundus erugo TaxID=2528639 RepID=A0A5R9GW03_9PROT|nr:hydrogenase maturation protease [Mariprofundus erugo]TLS68267.1 hydrogenase maturation protease [Mariprofundus erugo]